MAWDMLSLMGSLLELIGGSSKMWEQCRRKTRGSLRNFNIN